MTRWWIPPTAVTAIVTASALSNGSSVRDSVTFRPVAGVDLVLPESYTILSPLHRVLDLICLLSVPQHVAFLVSSLLVVVLWRRSLKAAVVFVALSAIIYAEAIAGPRPMAALSVADRNSVRVDFHSHTNVSGDARRSFDPMDNREWHTSAGYDVAYVTDHRRFRGARAAVAHNPARAGEGFVALTGFEGRIGGVDVVVPGLTSSDSGMIGVRQRLDLDTLASGREPVAIATIPVRNVERIDTIAGIDSAFIRAIEIVDGAPRGLLQEQRDGRRLREIARTHHLILVAGSNSHGWGRTASGWNLVTAPGWRMLAPDSLGVVIEDVLRERDASRLQVVERVRPSSASIEELSATLPIAVWQIISSLTSGERIAWIAWAWALSLIVHIRKRLLPTGRG